MLFLFLVGFETAKALALCGAHVILACRDVNKANKAAAMIRAAQVNFVVTLILNTESGYNIAFLSFFQLLEKRKKMQYYSVHMQCSWYKNLVSNKLIRVK